MRRSDRFLIQKIGGESVLVPIGAQVAESNGVVILNATAHCIWELLAEDCTVEELVITLVNKFDVDAGRAHLDVQICLDELLKMGIIEQ